MSLLEVFFIHLKIGFFSINKKFFFIGISLYRPIRGTKLNSKLNLIIYKRFLLIYKYLINEV